MSQYVQDHRDYLRQEYAMRLQRRPLYSQRAFARDLGVSSSTLTDYLKGRLRFSSGRVLQLGKIIGLSPEQKKHWIDLLETTFAKSSEVRQISSLRVQARLQAQHHSLSMDEFKVISEWFHFAYLELIEMDSLKYSDPKTAASALGIPLKSLKVAIKRLLALQLLKKKDDKTYQVEPSTQVGDQAPSEVIRHFHAQILKKALRALETHHWDRRFNSSTIVALPSSEVPKVIENLKNMAFQILNPYQIRNVPQEELYCLGLQFFDLLEQRK